MLAADGGAGGADELEGDCEGAAPIDELVLGTPAADGAVVVAIVVAVVAIVVVAEVLGVPEIEPVELVVPDDDGAGAPGVGGNVEVP
ncbi:MAG: hypothetical protein JOZ95_24065 [Solirubrobacterales bacterium]|nr:hypothetical protein [Solirubrobacterales bacterium]